jgi:hypothetical protein
MNEVFGKIPFSSAILILQPTSTGFNPEISESKLLSIKNSVINRNSKLSLTPYFHKEEGKVKVLLLALFF